MHTYIYIYIYNVEREREIVSTQRAPSRLKARSEDGRDNSSSILIELRSVIIELGLLLILIIMN